MKEFASMLNRPDFAVYSPLGELRELYCKVCGVQIGGGPKFTRYSNYVEVKFRCNDGSDHVTTGCNKCLSRSTSKRVLTAMLVADMRDLNRQLPLDIEPDIVNAFMNVRSAVGFKAIGANGEAAI